MKMRGKEPANSLKIHGRPFPKTCVYSHRFSAAVYGNLGKTLLPREQNFTDQVVLDLLSHYTN